MHTQTFTITHTCAHNSLLHACARTFTITHMCAHTFTINTCTHTFTITHMCTHIHYKHTHVHTHIHARMHSYTHTYTNEHTSTITSLITSTPIFETLDSSFLFSPSLPRRLENQFENKDMFKVYPPPPGESHKIHWHVMQILKSTHRGTGAWEFRFNFWLLEVWGFY